jgi:ADP-ribosyl-[dinitrogen reductase] hydrolase
VFGSACYIEDSFPVLLYLAHKYAGSFEGAVLANTNVGGENCHRGAALGAIMGGAVGESRIPPRFIEVLQGGVCLAVQNKEGGVLRVLLLSRC